MKKILLSLLLITMVSGCIQTEIQREVKIPTYPFGSNYNCRNYSIDVAKQLASQHNVFVVSGVATTATDFGFHAWIQVDGTYYEPQSMLDVNNSKDYVPLYKMRWNDYQDAITTNKTKMSYSSFEWVFDK